MNTKDEVSISSMEAFASSLEQGIVVFEYQKLNGDTRKAKGTLKKDLIPESRKISGTSQKKSNSEIQVYYDLNANAWRSFKKTLLKSWSLEPSNSA